MEKPFVAATREERLKGKKVVIVLEGAFLQLYERRRYTFCLATSSHYKEIDEHQVATLPEDMRPDIVHQCLLTLQDCPLNRSGHLLIYIRLTTNELIEVSPQLIVPRSWFQFEQMMTTFLQKRLLRAEKSNVVLLRLIKNDLEALFPPGSLKIGLSVTGSLVELNSYCKQFTNRCDPIVFFIGAVAKSNPTSKEALNMLDECVKISNLHLTAAICCGKICGEFEYIWKIV